MPKNRFLCNIRDCREDRFCMFTKSNKIFDIDSFRHMISVLGFDIFWAKFIRSYTSHHRPDLEPIPSDLDIDFSSQCFSLDNIGELYEIALEHVNKISKKELGQYYTPRDTADFMAKKLLAMHIKGNPIADVCCGTGNLIISVLQNMPTKEAEDVLANGNLYLYDLDKWAMSLAVMKIAILFIPDNRQDIYSNINNYIHCEVGNFLADNINLPNCCSVISNPPYGKLPKGTTLWFGCETYKTNEMYAIFIEKIAKQSKSAVVISPQSFLGSSKFSILRHVLSEYSGTVYAFDNVPASIFNGRKHGIFNTNTANSVRAAITIFDNNSIGFQITPLMRFKSTERKILFDKLDSFVGCVKNTTDDIWFKTPKTLESLVDKLKISPITVGDLISSVANEYKLTVPSTPRYFVSASARNLERGGAIEIYAKNKDAFEKLYVLLNSSISYLWWRICDGGITLTKDTLMSIPVPNISSYISDVVAEGMSMEPLCIQIKLNAGKNNENIKFPDSYRQKLNHIVLDSMALSELVPVLYSTHDNSLESVLNLWT